MELKVYIANLGKYNEGELVGAWFTLPVDYSAVAEKIGLNGEYEEYAIHDYELPFSIDEYESIENLNRYANMYDELDDDVKEIVPDLMNYFTSFDELCEHSDDLVFYPDCYDASDVDWFLVEEGAFGDIPEWLETYINFEAIGRDLSIERTFIETSQGIVEVAR